MTISEPMTLLGGLSPAQFMRRHWQKRPLLIRQAVPGLAPFVSRAALFALAGEEGVEARVVAHQGKSWTLRHGPFTKRSLPPASRPGWTLLVQGLDTHLDAAHELLSRFRFVPDARLDDLMVSWASDGGGVGPHVDSYDVFLLQIQGRRRWRIAPPGDATLVEGVPLKILKHFVPQEDWVLEPGDMLYLPPGWGHDGVAVDECMTASVGFRAAGRAELRDEVLQRMLDASERPEPDPLYRDPRQPATEQPAFIPGALREFAAREVARWLADPHAMACALGEVLSEPKPAVWFDAGGPLAARKGVRLDRRTRMLYDDRHVFINGEAFRAAGRDAKLMRLLADQRALPASRLAALSNDARELLDQWAQAGWLHSLRIERVAMDDDLPSSRIITSRLEFHAALKEAFALVADKGCREVFIADPSFSDWPLGERSVLDSLSRWAYAHRKLTVLAENFDEFPRRHPRWVEWRRQWAHVVDCRVVDEADVGQLSGLLLAPGVVSLRVLDAEHYRASLSFDPVDSTRIRDALDALLQRSEAAFPVTTLGL